MGGGERRPVAPKSDYPQLALRPVGQHITGIYRDRINQLTDNGQYGGQNLQSMMRDATYSGRPYVALSMWSAPGLTRPTFKEAMKGKFEDCEIGKWFGPSWSTHWFKVDLTIPKDVWDAPQLELQWDAGNEGLIWNTDGHPLQGLTGGERVEWVIPKSFRDGKAHTIYIEMACNGMFGNPPGGDIIQPPDPNKYFAVNRAEIIAINPDARGLWLDHWIIGDAAREFPQDSWEQHKAMNTLNKMINVFQLGDKESIKKARKIAQDYLGPNVDSHKTYKTGTDPVIFAIGHCHIDTCWLWPFDETKRKVARSWSNQCDLLDRYPEHNFVASQAQQWKWLKQYYPTVFDRVKGHVKEGRFHPIGGSWVEHDTNLPGGESLIRQFLYGQRFFEENFGERCKTFWLPDTFGYAAQLPQLCRLAGMDRFLTQKLSWNNINRFPHSTFNWVALDGSQVVCHMPPADTYTSDAHFGDVKRSMNNHKSLDQDDTALLVFGKGDGGGGPTWEHLEKLRRCRGMSDKVGLLPRVHLGKTVDEFFDRLIAKADGFATWYGELYFELHRGTYTTQANNKKNNRKAEFALRDVELLATIASLKDKKYKYPKKEIDEMWEDTLLCQFHDCLPGSSIEMCYDDSDKIYAKLFKTAETVLKGIYSVLGVTEFDLNNAGKAVAINTLPWHRAEIVSFPDTSSMVAIGAGNMLTLYPIDSLPKFEDEPLKGEQLSDDVYQLENEQLRVQIKNGVITSLYDRQACREVISKGGKANQYVLFDDKPLYWQAWDVEVYHLDSRKELATHSSKLVKQSAGRVSVVTETKISDQSTITTTISLTRAVPGQQSYVDVTADVDWHETMKFLKVEFPVDVHNTEASYETQFGIIRRPTHYNTSWDMAKFEVCSHKFADLSEHGYGVSILNDSKFGFATAGSMMRLSLLRAPKAPDAHADMGRHTIRWAILPHKGALGETTVRKAWEFNNPLKVVSVPHAVASEFTRAPVRLSGDAALVLDTVKRGEDDEDVSRSALPRRRGRSVVVRIFDSLGGRARGRVETSWEVKRVWKTNALEDHLEEVEVKEGGFCVELRAFEVATYRLQL